MCFGLTVYVLFAGPPEAHRILVRAIVRTRAMIGGTRYTRHYQSVVARYHHARLFVSRRGSLSPDSLPGKSTTCRPNS